MYHFLREIFTQTKRTGYSRDLKRYGGSTNDPLLLLLRKTANSLIVSPRGGRLVADI
jgi:hypothetical protein